MTKLNPKSEIRNPKKTPESETRNPKKNGYQISEFGFRVSDLERVLRAYDESLLRQVAGKLLRPRSHWPVDELIERCLGAFDNIAAIDRRLKELAPAERRLLALIGHSGQCRWRIVHLVEMATALGDQDGLQSVRNLFQAGLIFPELPEEPRRVRSWNAWLTQAGPGGPAVFTRPNVPARAVGEDLGLPAFPAASVPVDGIHEADGLEWPLRLGVIWQLARVEPLRRTQQGDYFKRDQDRMQKDQMLNSSPTDSLAELPDRAFFVAELAAALGVLQQADGECRVGVIPASWSQGLLPAIASLWSGVLQMAFASPSLAASEGGSRWMVWNEVMPSAVLLSLLYLGQLPGDAWGKIRDLELWISTNHPFWRESLKIKSDSGLPLAAHRSPIATFLLTIAYQLRLIQAGKDGTGEWRIRLSSIGRWLLHLGAMPAQKTAPSQTLLVQPNLEIVAYRQGLTPRLIGELSHFAAWKGLGAACLLQMQSETVYRALESGFNFDRIQQTLERHGTRPTPPAVLEMLRTWTAKRERLRVFPSATLFEFTRPEDLNDTLARGLPVTRLSDRVAVATSESAIDFQNFRLSGTRDYSMPPEKCIDVDDDGVTLAIDLDRSDLLVETELRRFALPWNPPGSNGRRLYRVTSASLRSALDSGLGVYSLEEWFQQRAGRSLPSAIRLLMTAPYQTPVEFKRQMILHVGSVEVADGLLQLEETRPFIQARLGPTALVIAPDHLDELRGRLEHLGLAVELS